MAIDLDEEFYVMAEEETRAVVPVHTTLEAVLRRAIDCVMENRNPRLKLHVMHKGMIYNVEVTTTSIHPPVGLQDDGYLEEDITEFGSRMQ